jgi:phage terminase large subunit-like protein
MDLSETTDLTAITLVWEPIEKEGKWDILSWVWLAGESLADVCRRDRLPYDKWLKEGNVIFEGKPVIDISSVKLKLLELSSKYKIKWIGYDPHLADEVKAWTEWEMIGVPQQTTFLSPPTKRIREKIMRGLMRHGGDPVLRAQVEAARVLHDLNANIRLDKSKSTSRIDALAALVNAEFISVRHPETEYIGLDHHDLIVI